jgi:large subunit ribosomal protein L6
MRINKKKFDIKIPNHISVIYSREKKIITFLGPLNRKSLKLNIQLFIIKAKNIIRISTFSFFKISNNQKKKLKLAQGTTNALLQQLIVETSVSLHQKLKLVGIGYKAFIENNFEKKILLFKLGYSHYIYFKIPSKIKVFCLKTTNLFIYGDSYTNITQIASFIRAYKKPDPYKGKGILYFNEKIKLKEGKKV